MLDEGTLVLESVTLAQVIELMVQVLIDLARRTILDEQAAKDTQAPHPHDLTVPTQKMSVTHPFQFLSTPARLLTIIHQ